MRWYQGWSINKFQLTAFVVMPVVSILLFALYIHWQRSHSPFHRIEVEPALTAAAPADPAARLDELLVGYRNASFRVTLTADVRFGGGKRIYPDQSELVWSRVGRVQRFDEMGVEKGALVGTTTIDGGATPTVVSRCGWRIGGAAASAVVGCRAEDTFFDTTILHTAISEVFGSPDQELPRREVAFYGITTQGGKEGECFSLASVGTRPFGVLCLTSEGVPLAMEGDLQGGYYHVSLRAIEVGTPGTVEQVTRQVVPFPNEEQTDYRNATIPLAQMALPSTVLVDSYTRR